MISGWSLRTRPKCRDLGEISAFGTGPRLEINIFMHFPLFKLNIDNSNNINGINDINNIGLELQDPSQMQRSLHLGRVPGLKSMYLSNVLYLSSILIISIILIILIILGWSLRTRPKCRDLGEISAFGTGSRLGINVFMKCPLFKLNIDNIDNFINIVNLGLEPQDPSQMQRSR